MSNNLWQEPRTEKKVATGTFEPLLWQNTGRLVWANIGRCFTMSQWTLGKHPAARKVGVGGEDTEQRQQEAPQPKPWLHSPASAQCCLPTGALPILLRESWNRSQEIPPGVPDFLRQAEWSRTEAWTTPILSFFICKMGEPTPSPQLKWERRRHYNLKAVKMWDKQKWFLLLNQALEFTHSWPALKVENRAPRSSPIH